MHDLVQGGKFVIHDLVQGGKFVMYDFIIFSLSFQLEFLRQLELLMSDGELGDLPNFKHSNENCLESSI